MKRLHRLLVLAAMGASPLAWAGSAEITVSGVIRPSACMPTLSGGGEYNFKTISSKQLSQTQFTQIDSPYQVLNIQCDGPTRFGLRAIDSRAGSAATVDGYNFGLGMNGSNKIGNYQLAILGSSIEVDGKKAVSRFFSGNGGASWMREDGVSHNRLTNSRSNTLHSFAPGNSSQPVAIQSLTAQMRVNLYISPLNNLDVGAGIELDGASTLEVHYL
ncbi:DUF1120 domain-containing protein [Pseudomonas putida]|uniref:DUF1120 domain-containing protein n=1 Tax=Pseudomonas TaxID=286 RepID=UPI00105A1B8B|nr:MULTISPECIES: DUF1120 domain-containing protein [Pseudomonas]MBF8746527.1 DUF1120 domain-containing protein [Pseudomonas monteilii]MCT8163584.1 DUF1120 domain-containing protein [Pseudomonas sp. HD6422]MCT8182420.1 DUF1120 domain-containing protein [Pseudomonas sp. HD6421]TDJ77688.1 DUF1120 domain-containing protein [Pseudomonas putida]